MLQLDITQPNLELLLEQPPAEAAPWTPTIEPQNVYWRSSTRSVICKWWDSKKPKFRSKSMHVEVNSDMDAAAKHGAVSIAAFELQRFYDDHHNQANNMPDVKRVRGADDESDETGPVRKGSRTDCTETE